MYDGNHIMVMTATRYTYMLTGFSNSLTESVRDKALYPRCKGTETEQKKKRQKCVKLSPPKAGKVIQEAG